MNIEKLLKFEQNYIKEIIRQAKDHEIPAEDALDEIDKIVNAK